MASQRIIKINESIRKEIAELIREGIKDPRLKDAMVSVVEVNTTNDLKYAKVYVSVLQENKQQDVLDGLNAAGGYIRKEVARKINLRNTPQFIFKLDESIAFGMKMDQVITEVMKKQGNDEA